MRVLLGTAAMGFLLGFGLSRIGFSSWDEVHRMFVFADLRMLFSFMVAVVILLVAWLPIGRLTRASWRARPIHPGTIPGSLIFGLGWAICGACPAIALVAIGEGQISGIATLAGILLGNGLYPKAHARWFRWPSVSCRED